MSTNNRDSTREFSDKNNNSELFTSKSVSLWLVSHLTPWSMSQVNSLTIDRRYRIHSREHLHQLNLPDSQDSPLSRRNRGRRQCGSSLFQCGLSTRKESRIWEMRRHQWQAPTLRSESRRGKWAMMTTTSPSLNLKTRWRWKRCWASSLWNLRVSQEGTSPCALARISSNWTTKIRSFTCKGPIGKRFVLASARAVAISSSSPPHRCIFANSAPITTVNRASKKSECILVDVSTPRGRSLEARSAGSVTANSSCAKWPLTRPYRPKKSNLQSSSSTRALRMLRRRLSFSSTLETQTASVTRRQLMQSIMTAKTSNYNSSYYRSRLRGKAPKGNSLRASLTNLRVNSIVESMKRVSNTPLTRNRIIT